MRKQIPLTYQVALDVLLSHLVEDGFELDDIEALVSEYTYDFIQEIKDEEEIANAEE